MSRVLLVDDEPALLFTLDRVLKSRGVEAVLARSGKEALTKLEGVDAVMTDYEMPEMDGVQLLHAIRERDDSLPVILLTAHGSERVAVRAMKSGAYDYVTKPCEIDEISLVIDRALETRSLRVENRRLSAEKAIGRAIIGDSPAIRGLLETVGRIAPKDITVLVRGATGTGKELIASLIHAESRRKSGPLVRFNCAAIPGELADAELFGHTRGAFTGAHKARAGYFAEANGGTLVLDEIGELALPLQAKLLRVLQEGEIQPVGAGRVEKIDVRIVACTNRNLAAEAKAGRFREDLYYRLAVVELIVPPLDDHREDIPALAAEFARRYADRFGMQGVRLSAGLIAALQAAKWPGNVRQLENTVARLVALHGGSGEIATQAFAGEASGSADRPPEVAADGTGDLREQLEELERAIIARTFAAVSGNQSESARRLGISRTSLIDRLKKYGLLDPAVSEQRDP